MTSCDRADRVLSLLRVPPPPALPVYGGGGVSVGPAVCLGPGAITMKEDWVQGAPLHLHTQLHTHFVPHTAAAGKDCPLQSSFRSVYGYPRAVVWGAKYPRGAKG